MRFFTFFVAALFFVGASLTHAAESKSKSVVTLSGAVGKMVKLSDEATKCGECHEDEVATFAKGFHAKSWAKKDAHKEAACSTCHGEDYAKHVDSQEEKDIISFTKGSVQSPGEQNSKCLSCHENTEKVAFWKSSAHAKNEVTCATCHNPHKEKKDMLPTSSETCYSCHKDVKNDVNKLSHHPIKEGKVTCIDCHNPHGTMNPKNIKAETNNLLCYKCHGDKRGPWLWEHPPVEENCMNCHKPHGSVHPKLLTERSPILCDSCHAAASHASQPFSAPGMASGTTGVQRFSGHACINCHPKIHGSMMPGNPATSGARGNRFFK